MYVINTSYPVPNRTHTIVTDKEYNRYVEYVATLDFGSQVIVNGQTYSAEDLRQMLLQADKVSNAQSTLIARYACQNVNIFQSIVPTDFKVAKTKKGTSKPACDVIFNQDLNRIDERQYDKGDVLWNVYVLCDNPFSEDHKREWVQSFKSTVQVDDFGNRYVQINDDPTREHCYSWASHKRTHVVVNKAQANALKPLASNGVVEKMLFVNPQSGYVTPIYKGADMG